MVKIPVLMFIGFSSLAYDTSNTIVTAAANYARVLPVQLKFRTYCFLSSMVTSRSKSKIVDFEVLKWNALMNDTIL